MSALTDGCPRYEVERTRPARLRDDPLPATTVSDTNIALRALLGSPEIGSRRWVFRQYDHLVGSGTVVRPGGDAAVVRLTPSQRAIAVSLDGNGRRTSLDPRRGGMSAVCEAARNVACTGARPAAVTNCLNFGNPETADVGYELAEAIEGMALACEALGLPGRLGQRLALQRAPRPAHPPDAGRRRGRRARRRIAGGRRRLPRGGRRRARSPATARPRSTARSTSA